MKEREQQCDAEKLAAANDEAGPGDAADEGNVLLIPEPPSHGYEANLVIYLLLPQSRKNIIQNPRK